MTDWHPGLDLPVTTGTATLIGYGRTDWAEVCRMLAGTQSAWAGYDGFHIGAPPQSPPPYSHLWAWTAAWLARIRVDGRHAITGVLALDGEPENGPPAQWRQSVRFQRARSQTWLETEKRVGPLAAGVAGHAADLYLIGGEHPVTFVAVQPPSAGMPTHHRLRATPGADRPGRHRAADRVACRPTCPAGCSAARLTDC